MPWGLLLVLGGHLDFRDVGNFDYLGALAGGVVNRRSTPGMRSDAAFYSRFRLAGIENHFHPVEINEETALVGNFIRKRELP